MTHRLDPTVENAKAMAGQVDEMLEPYRGLRFVGVVKSLDCVELVFSRRSRFDNLLSLWFDTDEQIVEYAHGFVTFPEAYVIANPVERSTA